MKKYLQALLLMTLLVHVAFAQKGRHVVRRVHFRPGSTSATFRGKATWGASYIYLVRARAGQTLTLHVEGVPAARVVPPGAPNYEALAGADNVRDWKGELPKTGVYQINVGHADDAYADAPYRLEIKIE